MRPGQENSQDYPTNYRLRPTSYECSSSTTADKFDVWTDTSAPVLAITIPHDDQP